MEKKRVIVDYSTLPDEVLEIMAMKYPNGYDNDIIRFPNAKKELISAVRVETDTTIFLVKVSQQLEEMVEDYELDDDDMESDDLLEDAIKTAPIPKEVLEDSSMDDDEDDDNYDRPDVDEDED
jgi:DNA-directed RNA polymerase subunit delta